MCTLRLHINQVLVEVFELFHGGPKGHNLAGGVCRGKHLCTRHPASKKNLTEEREKSLINIKIQLYISLFIHSQSI